MDGGGESVGIAGMLGSEGIGGRVIFGTEGNVGKDGNGVAVGSVGNGGNAAGKLGILGNCGSVGLGNEGIAGKLGSCSRLRAP